MHLTRVGVLRGGTGPHYDESLKTGAAALRHIVREGIEPVDILIDREGVWHENGYPVEIASVPKRIDVALVATLGGTGEDGVIQRTLESLHIPYTGSGALPSAHAFHVAHTKDAYRREGLRTPLSEVRTLPTLGASEIFEIFRTFPNPSVLKPVRGGARVASYFVSDFESFQDALSRAQAHGEEILHEAHVPGVRAECAVIEGFRGDPVYVLLPCEVRREPFSTKETRLCPGSFSKNEVAQVQEMTRRAHAALGLSHYSLSRFIVSPRGVYIMETVAFPPAHEESSLSRMLEAVGSSLKEFFGHLVVSARHR